MGATGWWERKGRSCCRWRLDSGGGNASARERIEKYRGEFPHAAYGDGLAVLGKQDKSDPSCNLAFSKLSVWDGYKTDDEA